MISTGHGHSTSRLRRYSAASAPSIRGSLAEKGHGRPALGVLGGELVEGVAEDPQALARLEPAEEDELGRGAVGFLRLGGAFSGGLGGERARVLLHEVALGELPAPRPHPVEHVGAGADQHVAHLDAAPLDEVVGEVVDRLKDGAVCLQHPARRAVGADRDRRVLERDSKPAGAERVVAVAEDLGEVDDVERPLLLELAQAAIGLIGADRVAMAGLDRFRRRLREPLQVDPALAVVPDPVAERIRGGLLPAGEQQRHLVLGVGQRLGQRCVGGADPAGPGRADELVAGDADAWLAAPRPAAGSRPGRSRARAGPARALRARHRADFATRRRSAPPGAPAIRAHR